MVDAAINTRSISSFGALLLCIHEIVSLTVVSVRENISITVVHFNVANTHILYRKLCT